MKIFSAGMPMREIEYLFIDGGSLRAVLEDISRRYFKGKNPDLDYRRWGYNKVFYYDSFKPQKRDESEEEYDKRLKPQEALFDRLRSISGWHVYQGTTRRRKKRVEQKKVDVMIAVDMLRHSIRGNMAKASLLTSDLDFKPLIDALVQEGMYVTLLYQPSRANKDLIHAADATRPLDIRWVLQHLPEDLRAEFPEPRASSRLGSAVSLPHPSKTGMTENGIQIKLYSESDEFRIVFPDQNSPQTGNFVHVLHRDPEFLELYVAEVFFGRTDEKLGDNPLNFS